MREGQEGMGSKEGCKGEERVRAVTAEEHVQRGVWDEKGLRVFLCWEGRSNKNKEVKDLGKKKRLLIEPSPWGGRWGQDPEQSYKNWSEKRQGKKAGHSHGMLVGLMAGRKWSSYLLTSFSLRKRNMVIELWDEVMLRILKEVESEKIRKMKS